MQHISYIGFFFSGSAQDEKVMYPTQQEYADDFKLNETMLHTHLSGLFV